MRRQRQERANQIAGFAFVQFFGDAWNRPWARPGALITIHCIRIYVMNERGGAGVGNNLDGWGRTRAENQMRRIRVQ